MCVCHRIWSRSSKHVHKVSLSPELCWTWESTETCPAEIKHTRCSPRRMTWGRNAFWVCKISAYLWNPNTNFSADDVQQNRRSHYWAQRALLSPRPAIKTSKPRLFPPLAPGPENVLIFTHRYCAVWAKVQNKEPHQKMLQTFSCVGRWKKKKKDEENKFGGEAKVFIVWCERFETRQ